MKKNYTIIAAVAAVIIVASAIAASFLLTPAEKPPDTPEEPSDVTVPNDEPTTSQSPVYNIDETQYGPYNSEHVHAALIIKVDGRQLDLSDNKYQLKSRFIHVENNDGTTLHRHAAGVPFQDFLKSIGMNIEDHCLVLDDGSKNCDGDGKKLRLFLNNDMTDSLLDRVVQDDDRILIIYGNEIDEQIESELETLQQITIITTGQLG